MRIALAALMVALPGLAFAAGGDDSSSPKPTETTTKCWGKRVYDAEKKRCVKPKSSSLSEQQLYDVVRDLAYLDRIEDAQAVLAAMPDQTDDRVLTYWGFTHRKLGNLDTAMMFYGRALDANPDNMLARSYMGQGLVVAGDLAGARVQMAEIEARGGGYTWAGTSLRKAIYTGQTFNY